MQRVGGKLENAKSLRPGMSSVMCMFQFVHLSEIKRKH